MDGVVMGECLLFVGADKDVVWEVLLQREHRARAKRFKLER